MTYTLRYARVVILERKIEVPDDLEEGRDPYEFAENLAFELEHNGELGIADLYTEDGSVIADIQDYDVIWELTED